MQRLFHFEKPRYIERKLLSFDTILLNKCRNNALPLHPEKRLDSRREPADADIRFFLSASPLDKFAPRKHRNTCVSEIFKATKTN